MNDPYVALATAIINEQKKIIGPLAINEANKVNGLKIDDGRITLEGDGTQILKDLVSQYANLFGDASVEACKDAVRPLLPKLKNVKIPSFLA